MVYQTGNTLIITCVFKDINGNNVNPTEVKAIFYELQNFQYTKLEERTLTPSGELGVYSTMYSIPEGKDPKKMVVEFKGLYVDGTYSLERVPLDVAFV